MNTSRYLHRTVLNTTEINRGYRFTREASGW